MIASLNFLKILITPKILFISAFFKNLPSINYLYVMNFFPLNPLKTKKFFKKIPQEKSTNSQGQLSSVIRVSSLAFSHNFPIMIFVPFPSILMALYILFFPLTLQRM